MSNKIVDITGLGRFFDNLKTYITGLLTTKQDIIEDLETLREGAALGATSIQDELVFVGTQEEYDAAYAEGKIKIGSLVIILEQEEIDNLLGAILGSAIIGRMKLGNK